MPALKPKLQDRELVSKIAEYVAPRAKIGSRPTGYRVLKVVVNARSAEFSMTVVAPEGSTRSSSEATSSFFAITKLLCGEGNTSENDHFYASYVRGSCSVLVTQGPKDGEFFVLAPVYGKTRLKISEEGLRGLPPGVPFATGWPSMQKRSTVFYAYFDEVSKSWGTPLGRQHIPTELPGQSQSGLIGLFATHRILRTEFRLCAFVYCDEDDNVLGFDDVSLKMAARMPITAAERGGTVPQRLEGYQLGSSRLQYAEEWLRGVTAPVGTTRVYYAETDAAFVLLKGPLLKVRNPLLTYRVRCVQRIGAGATVHPSSVSSEEFAARLKKYADAAGVVVRVDEPGEATPATERRLRIVSSATA